MKRIVCDATHDRMAKMAAIAVVWDDDDGLVAADIVMASNSTVAETLAVIRAVELMGYRFHNNSRIEIGTDCVTIPRWLAGTSKGTREQMELVARLKDQLARHPRFRIVHRPRDEVRAAHIVAGQTMKAWEAGKKHCSTWSVDGER